MLYLCTKIPRFSNYLFLHSLFSEGIRLPRLAGFLSEGKRRLTLAKTCLRTPPPLTECIPGPLTNLVYTVNVSSVFLTGRVGAENNTFTPEVGGGPTNGTMDIWTEMDLRRYCGTCMTVRFRSSSTV